MKATTLPRLVAALGAAALWTLMSPAPAAAIVCEGICLDFIELPNEGGITVTETGGPRGNGSLGPVTSETVTISDGTSGFTGLGTGTPYVFNLLEPDGLTISDQVVVTPGCGDCGDLPVSVSFSSDPIEFSLRTADRSTIEDGTRQLVGNYEDGKGLTVNIFVTSDLDAAVPAPATLLLLAAGLTGLAGTAWRRHRRA